MDALIHEVFSLEKALGHQSIDYLISGVVNLAIYRMAEQMQ